jgi:hypothetical protein
VPRSVVSWTEYHIRFPEKVESLTPAGRDLFWKQRQWHPVVQMLWNSEILSDGEGTITFPNGIKQSYNGIDRPHFKRGAH